MTGSPGVDARLVAALERMAQAVRVLQWDAAQPHGLSPAQLGILTLLADPQARAGDRSVGGLARLFDLSAPTVSDAVAALRRKGLVQATAVGPGRRQRLAATAAGHRLAAEVAGWDAPLRAALGEVPGPDRATALGVLLAMIGALQRAGVVTVARMCLTCRFYAPGAPGGGLPRCELLGVDLPPQALRVDCPEHEPIAVVRS